MRAHPDAAATIFEPTDAELAAWWRFLARWAALVAVVFVALTALSVVGQGAAGTATMRGAQYGRLELAIRSPGLHRAIETLEMTAWLMGNFVTVLALARLLIPHAPVRATLAAACAIAVPATGPVGRMMSRDGITELARLHPAATPDQQAALLRSFDDLYNAATAHILVGDLLVALALTLVGWAAFSHAAFPRWLAGWIAATGLVTLVRFALHELTGSPPFPPLLLLNTVVGIGGMHVILAAVFRRAAPRSTAAPAPLPATDR